MASQMGPHRSGPIAHPCLFARLGTRLDLDGLTTMVAFMGAPLVIIEKLINGKEVKQAIDLVNKIKAAEGKLPIFEKDGFKVPTELLYNLVGYE